MIAPDLALAIITLLPFWFLEGLDALGIRRIEVHHKDDGSIINSLAIAPGRLIMPEGVSELMQDQLRLAGVQVIIVPYDKMIAGGGLHCSTSPLVRDEVRLWRAGSARLRTRRLIGSAIARRCQPIT
jgi:N-dimethylarginine dimethylaminohydrolase